MTRPVNSSAQRAEISRRIDQLMEEEHQRPSTPPSPLDSEGLRSARVINKLVPVTNDPYLLRNTVPVLRLVGSKHERSAPEPVPFVAFQPPFGLDCCHTGACGDTGCEGHPSNQGTALEDRNDVDPVLRRRVWIAIAVWCLGCIGFGLYRLYLLLG